MSVCTAITTKPRAGDVQGPNSHFVCTAVPHSPLGGHGGLGQVTSVELSSPLLFPLFLEG